MKKLISKPKPRTISKKNSGEMDTNIYSVQSNTSLDTEANTRMYSRVINVSAEVRGTITDLERPVYTAVTNRLSLGPVESLFPGELTIFRIVAQHGAVFSANTFADSTNIPDNLDSMIDKPFSAKIVKRIYDTMVVFDATNEAIIRYSNVSKINLTKEYNDFCARQLKDPLNSPEIWYVAAYYNHIAAIAQLLSGVTAGFSKDRIKSVY